MLLLFLWHFYSIYISQALFQALRGLTQLIFTTTWEAGFTEEETLPRSQGWREGVPQADSRVLERGLEPAPRVWTAEVRPEAALPHFEWRGWGWGRFASRSPRSYPSPSLPA